MSLIIQRTPMDTVVSMCVCVLCVCLRPISQRPPANTVNEASISTRTHTSIPHHQICTETQTKTLTASVTQERDEIFPLLKRCVFIVKALKSTETLFKMLPFSFMMK